MVMSSCVPRIVPPRVTRARNAIAGSGLVLDNEPAMKIPEYEVCAVRIEAIRAAVRPGG